MNTEERAAQTPKKDLMEAALKHYEEAATAIHHWNSSIPNAIREYFGDGKIKKPTAKIELDGKTVEFYDAIHHNVTSTFAWWERIKILFGVKYEIRITIYVMNEEALVSGTKTMAWVPYLIQKKQEAGQEVLTPTESK